MEKNRPQLNKNQTKIRIFDRYMHIWVLNYDGFGALEHIADLLKTIWTKIRLISSKKS